MAQIPIMTGPFVRISSALLATLVVVGCRTEPVTWQVPLHDVILLNDTLSWSNLRLMVIHQQKEPCLEPHRFAYRPIWCSRLSIKVITAGSLACCAKTTRCSV